MKRPVHPLPRSIRGESNTYISLAPASAHDLPQHQSLSKPGQTRRNQVRPTTTMQTTISLSFTLLIALCAQAQAHGAMNTPNQRGSLSAKSPSIFRVIDADAPTDWQPHFPAGDKSPSGGAGVRSQVAEAGPAGWTPFTPLARGFRWRAGVCGDRKGGVEDHRRGGRFYHHATIVATYQQGAILHVGLTVNAHHNGFIEMHICDIAQCGGEISEACFRKGHCRQLARARDSTCQSAGSMECGPIDRAYPGRWYLPCSKYPLNDFRRETYGPETIRYQLPPDLECEHCVLQWFWTAANNCNPPGVVDYFTGGDRPRAWLASRCRGQGGAVGGFAAGQKECGGDRFPEEYLQCADIRILPRAGRRSASSPKLQALVPVKATRPPVTSKAATAAVVMRTRPPAVTKKTTKSTKSTTVSTAVATRAPPVSAGSRRRSSYNVKRARRRGHGSVRDIVLVGDGRRIISLYDADEVVVGHFRDVSVEAIVMAGVKRVAFFVDGVHVKTDKQRPFFIAGKTDDGRPNDWSELRVGKRVKVAVVADGDYDSVIVRFVK